MCERLKKIKWLAKKDGDDPRLVRCAPDIKALCTCETECALIEIFTDDTLNSSIDMVNKFYKKLEKREELFGKYFF